MIEHALAWQDVHRFWFPEKLADADHDMLVAMSDWWMRGGANAELARFGPVVDAAVGGQLGHWCTTPAGRVSLIVVLDQFTRGLFAGTPQAFASDPIALALAEEGLRSGDYDRLATPWEQAFFLMPLGHTEGPGHLQRLDVVIAAAQVRLAAAPTHLKRRFEYGVSQPKGHREVIARFGRFPHRNAILDRASTPEELAYLEAGDFVHERRPPS